MRLVLRVFLVAVVALAFAEGALRIASSFASGRSVATGGSNGRETILCVGDSHTYGAMVEEGEAYPGQLEHFLNELEPGRYEVVNLGIPGHNTAQVLQRLPDQIASFAPSIIIVWAGVNDGWNKTSTIDQSSSPLDSLESLVMSLKLVKFFRVWSHDRKIDAALKRPIFELDGTQGRRVVGLGYSERYDIERYAEKRTEDKEIAARLRRNYRQIERLAREAGARALFIAYPLDKIRPFRQPNRAMREAGVPLFESFETVWPLPKKQKEFLWAGHPNKFMYQAIARDLASRIARDDQQHSRAPAAR
jgi:lysophospholipase L1-like esterase